MSRANVDDGPPDVIVPAYLGPTWQPRADGALDDDGRPLYELPERTLGWAVLAWIAEWVEEALSKRPFLMTDEQARFVLWWYAIDEHGEFLYYDGVLQRLKGWGKDPLVAALSLCELVGPCRFGGWDEHGEPIVVSSPRAWVQIAAVSESQSMTTMSLFTSMVPDRTKREFGIEVMRTIVYAETAQRRIESVTKSPRAMEGKPVTCVIRNETHHWVENNLGHEMNAVIERNTVKGAGGAARALSITNAYNPTEDSVAQRAREAYVALEADEATSIGMLYDSLEAPPETPLHHAWLDAVLNVVRGDSYWVPIKRMAMAIMDPRADPGQSRRFYFNQIVATEDSWLDPRDVAQCERPELGEGMRHGALLPSRVDDKLILTLDCSKSDDSTALIGTYLSDGHHVTLGIWQRPKSDRGGETWVVNVWEVDERVRQVFEMYDVIAFWGDPSHAKNDEDDTRMWDSLFDSWHEDFADQLLYWAVQSGNGRHAVMWDMTSPDRVAQFTAAAERTMSEFEEHTITFDGHPATVAHLRNAKRFPNRYGVSIWKGSRESSRKIDLAVTLIMGRMLRRLVRIKGPEAEQKPKYKTIWGGI